MAWFGKVGRYSGFVDDSAKFNLRGEGVLVCEVLVVVNLFTKGKARLVTLRLSLAFKYCDWIQYTIELALVM